MTASQAPIDVYHVQADDPEYAQMLRDETEYWDSREETLLSATTSPNVQAYRNERFTGDASKRWFETTGNEGAFSRGCIFGAGPGHVEEALLKQHPSLHLTVFDISGEALARLKRRLNDQFAGRVETQQLDLNFVDLPSGSYDLVVANSSMHHLVNLEHVAFQINQTLTADGRFFMADTVCESFFQFSDEKKRIFQLLIDATQGTQTSTSVEWPDRSNWAFSPFESVRSGEVLEVLARYMEPVSLRVVGALLSLAIFVRTESARSGSRHAIAQWLLGQRLLAADEDARAQLLFLVDSLVCDVGRLVPGEAFAIYGKRVDHGLQ